MRADRRTTQLLRRLRPGDLAVIDHQDLDRTTATALVEAGVVAVVNAAPMSSGRFPNLGPEVLVEAGIPVVDGVGTAVFGQVDEGRPVRLWEGELYDGDTLLARGREVDGPVVAADREAARAGMAAQLDSFVHNSAAFLRREQDLLLHGTGLPALRVRLAGRPVAVVAPAPESEARLREIRRFVREQRPALVGVGTGADTLLAVGLRPDVVVVDGRRPDDLPSTKALRAAKDVVALVDQGGGRASIESLERRGVRPHRLETTATEEDAALVVAQAGGASVIVGVGMSATLEEFLDRRRPGLASTYLTRLKVGARLVDAGALPVLYSGRVRPWHLLLVLLAGLVAVATAVASTPVGQQWVHELAPSVRQWVDDLRGLVP